MILLLQVAPVLKEGQRKRDVYLPPATQVVHLHLHLHLHPPQGEQVWCMSDSSVHSGGKWLNDTKVAP